MHMFIFPISNKVVMFDGAVFGPSQVQFSSGIALPTTGSIAGLMLSNTTSTTPPLGHSRYSTQQILPDGSFVVVGGRRMFNYEYVLQREKLTRKISIYHFSDKPLTRENNLYPFVFLSTDGNLFIFANNRSILLNPTTNKIIRYFPILTGGSRNHPASAMAALLPIKIHDPDPNPTLIRAQVLICGGAKPEAATLVDKGVFVTDERLW
ncbi:hypothetical protein FNV43_RR12509 [Rhamnella rubrinervis]|uniref:Glyoxal oxidase N-terminal domain-containing protein n=1 Tax=Rhamnella rubrinervis TaxID=2594499 RepID=A0A8K0MIW0_9ROSA|nr:hypothetical protein FNV43_RR12509 [Rhamnella rubrinervis]